MEASQKADWQNAFRDKPMYLSTPLRNWVIICKRSHVVSSFLQNIQRAGRGMHFEIASPIM